MTDEIKEIPMSDDEREMVARALKAATEAFGREESRTGTLTVLHSLRVGLSGSTAAQMAAGFLHDVLEDVPSVAAADLAWLREDVFEAVCALTHRFHSKAETYEDFIERVKKAGPLAIAVKINDINDNLARVLNLADGAERLRLRKKWLAALAVLR